MPSWSEKDKNDFLAALRLVETGGEPNNGVGAVGDNGKALGPYQIWKAYYQDAVEYDPTLGDDQDESYERCLNDLEYSRKIVWAYVRRYGKTNSSMEDMARLHNSGPNWKKKIEKTDGYVKKFREKLAEIRWLSEFLGYHFIPWDLWLIPDYSK